MSKKSKSKKFVAKSQPWEEEATQVIIPDEAVYHIVSNYLQIKRTTGVSVLTGVSTQTVEDILQLLVNWGAEAGKIKQGVLHLGEKD